MSHPQPWEPGGSDVNGAPAPPSSPTSPHTQGNTPYTEQPWAHQAGATSPPPPPPGAGGKGLKRVVLAVAVIAVLGLLGVVGVAISQSGSGGLPSAPGADAGQEQLLSDADISQLLQGRTQALKSGNEQAFLSAFSGDARDQQKKIFENLRKVPFEQAEYRVLRQTGTGYNDYGHGASVALDVAFVHKIQNVDVQPVAEWYRWVIQRPSKSAQPSITRVGGSPSAYGEKGFVYYPSPWDVYSDMYVQKQAHTLIVADNKNAAMARRYAPDIEKGAADDVTFWSTNAPPGAKTSSAFLVDLEPDRKTYSTMFASQSSDLGWDAGQSVPETAFTATYGAAPGKRQFGGARIKMDTTSGYFKSGPRGVQQIAHHEMAHSLLQPLDQGDYSLLAMDGGPRTWAVEGFAEYIAAHFDPQRGAEKTNSGLSNGLFDGKLPNSKFGSYPHSVEMDYSLSFLVMKYIEQHNGQAAALQFVVDQYQHPKDLDQQLQKAVGRNGADFENDWATYVRSQIR